MATTTLPASGPIATGGETIVGPFAFVPTQVGHECLLAIAHADGDAGNDTTITGTIPENRLVPFDNNIGQRNVSPILPKFRFLVKWFEKHIVLVRNPYKIPVVANIDIKLPRFLRRLGWEMKAVSRGGTKFEMGPREKHELVLHLEPGEQFEPELARKAMAEGDDQILLTTYLDGEVSGGMTYQLTFEDGQDEKPDPEEEKPKKPRDGRIVIPRRPTIEEILRILRGQVGRRTSSPIRTIRLELDFDDDDELYDDFYDDLDIDD